MAQRQRRLAHEPLCRHCRTKGLTTPATVPDHIVPLAYGGADVEENIQCLCEDCHAIKTATEGAATGGASNHPDWLKPSAIPLTILCGPPCSGKTTYIAERSKPGDIVIDIDVIARNIDPTYTPWDGKLSTDLLNKAIRTRNEMLGSLARQHRRQAWFIVSAPTSEEREWWRAKLEGDLVLLHPGIDECKRRATQRGTPRAAQGVDEWERRAREPWRVRVGSACDANGRPTDTRHPWNRPRGGV